ncbi:hypothetical protein HIM_01637 [Hirsutella minnesotensis 3608]|nr:hypothetical protein HIM_01637 [Hirsutella minnesotensis 3608]
MLAPAALRGSPAVASAVKSPSAAARRAFHTSVCSWTTQSPGGEPADDPSTDHNPGAEPQAGTETSGGRIRGHGLGSLRARQARRQTAAPLPPVEIPKEFLQKNVYLHHPLRQPRLPGPLLEDAKNIKISRLFADEGPGSGKKLQALATYFEDLVSSLLERQATVTELFDKWSNKDLTLSVRYARQTVRCWDDIIDAAWHYVDSIYPARRPEYSYKVRPAWWWDVYKDYDRRSNTFRHSWLDVSLARPPQVQAAGLFDYPTAHALADLPFETKRMLRKSLLYSLETPAPPDFDSRTHKRPITVLSLSGYGGKSIPEAFGEYVAYGGNVDLVRLDAYELSVIVGEYIGQNWAYARGAVSMLGFRTAELGGRLPQTPEVTERRQDEDESDPDTRITGLPVVSTIEEGLSKIKQGAADCFPKWELLKVDKALDQIIRCRELIHPSTKSRPLIIQVHDIVELSMTMEGSHLINRLRALVDAAWQSGAKITILGTSSCEHPSEEYQSALRELSFDDFVVTRHIQPDLADKQTAADADKTPFSLRKADNYAENMLNVKRMLRSMSRDLSLGFPDPFHKGLRAFRVREGHTWPILRDDILPVSEIYHLASSYCAWEARDKGNGFAGFVERICLGPLRHKADQSCPKKRADEDADSGKPANETEKSKAEPWTSTMKLNDYEKRVSTGKIDRENLRTSFADVHVPPETISALKLLTSLTLVRPDAFSYGVLAQDKIPGCLLYGPPGTGKTMLAKAVAKESGANMLEISGAMIHDKWVGESEKLIRAVFTLAKRLSPCVVFIDEADSLFASRSMFANRVAHRDHLNQFLREWDGMNETNAFIMVATNRPFDLDEAVLRRLPRKILVDLPLKDDRAAIMHLLLKGETLDPSVDIPRYAEMTRLYSGSDLKNMCVAAAMSAVEEENAAAAKHTGPEPFRYPERRVLRHDHFERALKQIPASISEDMASLKMIRKFDDEYGSGRKDKKKKTMGFGVAEQEPSPDSREARIRQGAQP